MTTNSVLEGPLQSVARRAWQTVLVTGILAVILGVLILVWPDITLLAAGIIFGVYLVVTGFMQLLAAFGAPASAGLRVMSFIVGVLSIIIGVFCFRDELASILLLGLWIGIGWLFRGIALLMGAISEPTLPGRWWQVFFGLLTAIAGVVLIIWPVRSVATLALLAGVWLIVLGVMEIVVAFGIRKDARALRAAAA
ncbi:HdeD family acid-resistance protein [Nocardia sp. NPDC051787]|uniref:HdeD family acid-resistance protein n=1 Tax=Nocardia sp. NPDC051787 TaxID=3155415 RepID=UPI0034420C88